MSNDISLNFVIGALHFRLTSLEPFKDWLSHSAVDKAIVELASNITEENYIAFGSFETYEDD